jgi:hypothetical protein
MWEYYLVASEMSFRYAGFMVFQIQLAKAVGAVPLTRDYLFEAERKTASSFDLPTSQNVQHVPPLRDAIESTRLIHGDDPVGL